MKRTLVILVAVAIVIGLLGSIAFALPQYSQKTGKPCSYCHKNPSGGKDLTSAGQYYQKNKKLPPAAGTQKTTTAKPKATTTTKTTAKPKATTTKKPTAKAAKPATTGKGPSMTTTTKKHQAYRTGATAGKGPSKQMRTRTQRMPMGQGAPMRHGVPMK